MVDFFATTVRIFKTYPTYAWLSQAGIVPSNSTTYALADLQAALKKQSGAVPYLGCYTKNGVASLDEVWCAFLREPSRMTEKLILGGCRYFSHSNGPPQLADLHPVDSTTPSSCPPTGISYFQRSTGSER